MTQASSVEAEARERIVLRSNEESVILYGRNDQHLRMIEQAFDARIVARSNEVEVMGPPQEVTAVVEAFEELLEIVRRHRRLETQQVRYVIGLLQQGRQPKTEEWADERIVVTHRKKVIRPKTQGQKQYIDAIRKNDVVFGIGPAGTGKTYLAMASAVSALNRNEVSRMILARPAVEAGESLGFLPGDMLEKVNPYLRPLYDALYDMLEVEKVRRFLDRGLIEIAPLAFMRGRTLNDSFIILDEAQNTTREQMKMFLTRLGNDSKTVITGDITQIDLPRGKKSGLVDAAEILAEVEGIALTWFTRADVVRHPIVQKIIDAYERQGAEESLLKNGDIQSRTESDE
jgi:phosphate starvation-inducible protein PhoH and related proteins